MAYAEQIMNIKYFVRMGMSAMETYKMNHVCTTVMHYIKSNILSGINASKKAGKVSKTMDALVICRLPALLRKAHVAVRKKRHKTITQIQVAESVGVSEATGERKLVKDLNMHRVR
ncbi:hypothetical protein TNCV_2386481 [Trichonephila clavipes]|nr:hypothetical protein TNCV_2386481 [Trichonephila clavipes]